MQRRPTELHLLNNKKYISNPNTVSQSFLRECIYVSTWEQTHDAVSLLILCVCMCVITIRISFQYTCVLVLVLRQVCMGSTWVYVYMFAFNRILIGCSRCGPLRYYVTFWCSSFFEYLVKDLYLICSMYI